MTDRPEFSPRPPSLASKLVLPASIGGALLLVVGFLVLVPGPRVPNPYAEQRPEGDFTEASFDVSGWVCPIECTAKLREAAAQVDGVQQAYFFPDEKRVVVRFAPGTSVPAIGTALGDTPFGVTPDGREPVAYFQRDGLLVSARLDGEAALVVTARAPDAAPDGAPRVDSVVVGDGPPVAPDADGRVAFDLPAGAAGAAAAPVVIRGTFGEIRLKLPRSAP